MLAPFEGNADGGVQIVVDRKEQFVTALSDGDVIFRPICRRVVLVQTGDNHVDDPEKDVVRRQGGKHFDRRHINTG